jgi:hypothetical protein
MHETPDFPIQTFHFFLKSVENQKIATKTMPVSLADHKNSPKPQTIINSSDQQMLQYRRAGSLDPGGGGRGGDQLAQPRAVLRCGEQNKAYINDYVANRN